MALSIGTMNFGARTPAAEASRIVDRALERGAVWFDTANMYGEGESERILGTALTGGRDKAKIATKVGLLKREGLGKARVIAALDESLKRLKTDYVDLYYLHAPDHKTPLADSLEGMATVLKSGKAKAWGVSNYGAWQIGEINVLCDAMGLARPTTSQVLYNLLIRQLDVEYFAFTRAHPIHTTVYNPLAGGLLARTPAPGDTVPPGSRFDTNSIYRKRYWNAALFELAAQYRTLAASLGLSLVALSYAWLAGRPGVSSILTGPGSVAHLDDAFDGCAVQLSPETRTQIDDLYRAFTGTDTHYAR